MKLLKCVFAVSLASFAIAVKAAFGAGPVIYVSNVSATPDAAIQNALPAFQAQVDEDFAPDWNAPATVQFSDHYVVDAWNIQIVDIPDCLFCAGYHGVIWGKPMAVVATQAGIPWQLVFSHELLEMLADPYVNRAAYNWPNQVFYMIEVCDPVEWLHLAYNRPGADGTPVILSDFVTENWYTGAPGKKDFMGYVHKQHQVLRHGYAVSNSNGDWHESKHFYPF